MGYARACSVALVGVEGVVVEVQADLEPGVAAFTLVGLPDKSLIESRDRVRAAVVNSGAEWPQKKLTVGLSPASVPKSGSGFDLAVACAVLGAAERLDPAAIADVVMIGELGLDGRVRPVRGCCRPSSRRPRPGTSRSSSPSRRPGRLPWCRASRSSASGACASSSRSSATNRSPTSPSTTGGAPTRCSPGSWSRARGSAPGWPRPPRAGRGTPRTSRTWRDSRGPARPWRWRPPGDTICCSRARRVRARPCWPSGSRRSCRP